jgi:hypothetical protein
MKTPLQTLLDERKVSLDEIVHGIDVSEVSHDHGWWETNSGAEFGLKVRKELELHDREYETFLRLQRLTPLPTKEN